MVCGEWVSLQMLAQEIVQSTLDYFLWGHAGQRCSKRLISVGSHVPQVLTESRYREVDLAMPGGFDQSGGQ